MRNHTARFTPNGVRVRATEGLEVYLTQGGMVKVASGTTVDQPYRSVGQALSHIAKMFDAAESLLKSHPGHTTTWLPFDEAKALTRQAA